MEETLHQRLARIDAHVIAGTGDEKSREFHRNHPEWDNVDSLAFMQDEYLEAPEITDEQFESGQFFYNSKPNSREEGIKNFREALTRGRPKLEETKVMTSIRLSPEVVNFFKAGGKGWQTRLDAALLNYVKTAK